MFSSSSLPQITPHSHVHVPTPQQSHSPLHVSSLWCWYVESCGMCSHVFGFLCLCVLMFVYSLMLCIVSCSCVVLVLHPCPCIHALALMPLYSCPRAQALVSSLIRYLLVCSAVSCFPASIVLSLVFHGFVYVLPVWSFIKPLFCYIVHMGPSFFIASHPLTL